MRSIITFTRWLVKFVRILVTLKVQVVIVSLLCHVMKLSIPLKNENLLLTSGKVCTIAGRSTSGSDCRGKRRFGDDWKIRSAD